MDWPAVSHAERERDLERVAALFDEVSQMYHNTTLKLKEASSELETIRKTVDQSVDTNAENVDQVTDGPEDSGTSAHHTSQALHPGNFDRKFRTFRSLAYRYVIMWLCVFVALCHFKSGLEVLMGLAFCVGKDSFLL